MPLTTLFLDLNAYFASVEQQVTPRLRGKPIGVSPIDAPSGCCIAVSYEAKKFGVKTGTTVGEARRLCPDIQIVPARPRLYVIMHHRVLKAVETCIPIHKVHSIDEMSCKLDRTQRDPEEARILALRIKEAIRRQCGQSMRCSIGIAPNRVLAKLGTDMHKPNGLIILAEEDLPTAIEEKPPQELSGIGPRMAERLTKAGIHTVGDLLQKSEKEMRALWGGLVGERWYHWLRGKEVIEPPTHKSSIGHQHVLAPNLRTFDQARSIAYRLLLKAAARLRHEQHAARKLTLGLSFSGANKLQNPWGGASWSETVSLGEGCVDSPTILEALSVLWASVPTSAAPVFVSVVLHDLVPPGSISLPLFQHEAKLANLSKAMDVVNNRFGANKVYTANMQDVRDSGTGGIAFNVIPDITFSDSVQSRQRGEEQLLSDADMEEMIEKSLCDQGVVRAL